MNLQNGKEEMENKNKSVDEQYNVLKQGNIPYVVLIDEIINGTKKITLKGFLSNEEANNFAKQEIQKVSEQSSTPEETVPVFVKNLFVSASQIFFKEQKILIAVLETKYLSTYLLYKDEIIKASN